MYTIRNYQKVVYPYRSETYHCSLYQGCSSTNDIITKEYATFRHDAIEVETRKWP